MKLIILIYNIYHKIKAYAKVRDISQPNCELVTKDTFSFAYGVQKIVHHPNKKAVFLLSRWGDLYIILYEKYYNVQYPSPLSIDAKLVDINASEKKDLAISQDGKYAYMVCNSIGIFLIDIQDLNNPFILQILKRTTILANIGILSSSKEFIYLTNLRGLLVFQTVMPLYHEKWTGPTKDYYPWTTKMTKNKTLLWMAIVADGLRCFDITKLPSLTLLVEYNETFLPGFSSPSSLNVHQQNDDIIFTCNWGQKGFYVLNVKDIYKPEILSFIDFGPGRMGHSVQTIYQNPNKLVLSALIEVVIIDITDLKNAHIFARSKFPDLVFQEIRECAVTKDGRFIYAPENNFGVIIAMEVSEDMKTISYLGQIPLILAQKIIISNRYSDVIYAFSNLAGLKIYNITEKLPKLISEIQLEGFLWDVLYPEDENSLFLAASQRNELMMVDIHELENPQLISIFQIPFENGFRLTVVEKENQMPFVIINTSTGIRSVPIRADVRLNIEVFKQNSKSLLYEKQIPNKMDIYPVFYVGENGKAEFQILNNPQVKQIDQFYYYDIKQPEILQELSNFIQFDNSQNIIYLDAVKSKLGFNTVITKVFLKMTEKELEIPGKIDSDLAKKIVKRAQEFNYLTIEGYPTDIFNIDQSMILLNDDGLQNYANDLKNVLKKKIQFVPFSFIIKQSLFFNFNQPDISNGFIIDTLSDQIEISMQVDGEYAEFFKQNFQGVLSSYSENQNEIILQGKKISLNKILSSVKLEIYNMTKKDDLVITIKIEDGLNERLNKELKLQEIRFLKINQPVQIGDNIQAQFEKVYDKWSIRVEEEFQFTFNQNSFVDDDELQYSLWAYVEERGKYVLISQFESFQGFSITFQANERLIRGTILRNMLRKKLKLKIEATDGYSSKQQNLYITANQIPFFIMVYYAIFIGSGIISILGIIKYRGIIYLVLCRKRYYIGEFEIERGKDFLIQILLSKSDTIVVQTYKNLLLKQLKSKGLQLSSLFVEKIENPQKYVFDFNKIVKELKEIKVSQDIKSNVKFQNSHSIQFVMLKSFLYQEIFKRESKSRYLFNKLQKCILKSNPELNRHRWYEYITIIQSQEINERTFNTPKVYFKQKVLYELLTSVLKDQLSGKQLKEIQNQVYKILIQYDAIQINDSQFEQWVAELQNCLPSQFNIFLVLEMIKIEALGFVKLQLLSYSHGQCIQKKMSDIQIAKALVKRKSIFIPIYKMLNMEYTEIALSQNKPLPSWIDFQCGNNIVEIFGKCDNEEEEDQGMSDINNSFNQKTSMHIKEEENLVHNQNNIMIRIHDVNKLICREFLLKKKQEYQLESSQQRDISKMRLKGVQIEQNICVEIYKSRLTRNIGINRNKGIKQFKNGLFQSDSPIKSFPQNCLLQQNSSVEMEALNMKYNCTDTVETSPVHITVPDTQDLIINSIESPQMIYTSKQPTNKRHGENKNDQYFN